MKTPNFKVLALMTLLLSLSLTSLALAGPLHQERALFAYLKVRPGTQGQFLEAAKDVIAKSRREPGALIYILNQELNDPTQFVFYELFKNEDALQYHRKSKHVVDFLNTVNPIVLPGQFILREATVH